jgi:hypothetical protein
LQQIQRQPLHLMPQHLHQQLRQLTLLRQHQLQMLQLLQQLQAQQKLKKL